MTNIGLIRQNNLQLSTICCIFGGRGARVGEGKEQITERLKMPKLRASLVHVNIYCCTSFSWYNNSFYVGKATETTSKLSCTTRIIFFAISILVLHLKLKPRKIY